METYCATKCEICGKARGHADHRECSKVLQQKAAGRKKKKREKTLKAKSSIDYLAKF